MNPAPQTTIIDEVLLREVQRRHKEWRVYWSLGFTSNMIVGILGVVASSLAAISHEPYSRFAAAISAVCFAIIGFARPDQFYFKFIIPWRILDKALFRYQFQNGSREELISGLEEAEATLTGIEMQQEVRAIRDDAQQCVPGRRLHNAPQPECERAQSEPCDNEK